MGEPQRNRERVLELLWAKAEDGNVQAMKALHDILSREEGDAPPAPAEGSWDDIYGATVTPIERKAG